MTLDGGNEEARPHTKVGTGSGAGMGLMFVISGILGIGVGLGGYLFPAVRNVERILPDHDATPAQADESAAEDMQPAEVPAT